MVTVVVVVVLVTSVASSPTVEPETEVLFWETVVVSEPVLLVVTLVPTIVVVLPDSLFWESVFTFWDSQFSVS